MKSRLNFLRKRGFFFSLSLDINLLDKVFREEFFYSTMLRVALSAEDIWNLIQILDMSSVDEIFSLM